MIKPEQLPKLKPLPDQVKRVKAEKKRRKIPNMKKHLTRLQRKNRAYPAMFDRKVRGDNFF